MEKRICITTTSKVSLKDTMDFINYHINIGIDHIYIFFDDPNDAAIKSLADYKNVTCFKCNSNHWKKMGKENEVLCLEDRQELNANLALKLARQSGYDWIIHLDTDELIYSRGLLKKKLNKVDENIDVLRLLSMEAVPERMNYKNNLREISLFKSIKIVSKFYYSHKKTLQKLIPYFKKNEGKLKVRTMYFNSHATGKSIVSTKANIKSIGMHEPIAEDKFKYYYPNNISLLHFECKNFEDWKKKWIKVCDAPSDTTGYEDGKFVFFTDFKKAYKNNDEEKIKQIYKDFYFISSKKKMLLMVFGLLSRVKLNRRLFTI